MTGAIFIEHGKGYKARTAFIGQKSRRLVKPHLKQRQEKRPALWVTWEGTRLCYNGLVSLIRGLSIKTKVKRPGIHDFRRAFALNMLRDTVDVYILAALTGHSDLAVLRRYLAITKADIQEAHRKPSPGDKL
jgi:integrase/recombinase XerD